MRVLNREQRTHNFLEPLDRTFGSVHKEEKDTGAGLMLRSRRWRLSYVIHMSYVRFTVVSLDCPLKPKLLLHPRKRAFEVSSNCCLPYSTSDAVTSP